MKKYMFRYAEEKDVSLILYFIKELAKYEEMFLDYMKKAFSLGAEMVKNPWG